MFVITQTPESERIQKVDPPQGHRSIRAQNTYFFEFGSLRRRGLDRNSSFGGSGSPGCAAEQGLTGWHLGRQRRAVLFEAPWKRRQDIVYIFTYPREPNNMA